MKQILLIFGGALLALTAHGSTIVFSTFGPGDTYNPSFSYFVGNGANNDEPAAQFTAGASGNLVNVDLGLTYFNGSNPANRQVNVFLYGDAGGSPDNANQTLLGSVTPTALFDGVTNNSVVSFSVAGTVPVTAGSIYWLVLKPTSFGTDDAWNLSSPPITGLTFVSHDDSTWAGNLQTLPAFRLTVSSAIPDSGDTIVLMIWSGVGTLLVRPLLRRQQG
jgi:peptidoglycan hydrolase-like protein with peptidoglycan-binding domain